MLRSWQELQRTGHRRIGLAMGENTDVISDHRYTAAYYFQQRLVPLSEQFPVLISDQWQKQLPAWFRRWRPDAIITAAREPMRLLLEMGIHVPGDLSLVHSLMPPPTPARPPSP